MDLVSVFCRQIPSFPAKFVEETVSSPWYVFGNFVKKLDGYSFPDSYPLFCGSSYLFLWQHYVVFIAISL
jgi:hypothetical protein